MPVDISEYLVGAYLRLVEKCDCIDYNVRTPDGGREGLNELDVVGINLKTNVAFLCEVTTHIRGLLYKNNQETVHRITKKYKWQQEFAARHLRRFRPICQFWSPVVPVGILTRNLAQITDKKLELIVNGEYKRRIEKLEGLAAREHRYSENPAFRLLQILKHLRGGQLA